MVLAAGAVAVGLVPKGRRKRAGTARESAQQRNRGPDVETLTDAEVGEVVDRAEVEEVEREVLMLELVERDEVDEVLDDLVLELELDVVAAAATPPTLSETTG